MGGVNKAQFDKLAQGVAQGLTKKAAAELAGYRSGSFYQVTNGKAFEVRVAELREHLEWGGSRQLGPVIDELKDVARAARELKSAAGMNAARGALVSAAKFKQLLPREETIGLGREMTLKEWAAKRGATS